MQIDLVLLNSDRSDSTWPLGKVWDAPSSPKGLGGVLQDALDGSAATAFIFWDPKLGVPDSRVVADIVSGSGDIWHAGLALGMEGKPRLIDMVSPTWMHNCDPDSGIEATSWRISLRACVIRTEVFRQLGGIRLEFRTIEAAALEMGHRFIRRGALPRHIPSLVPSGARGNAGVQENQTLPFVDELRFVLYRFGRKWAVWALARAALSGYIGPIKGALAAQAVLSSTIPPQPEPFQSEVGSGSSDGRIGNRVTVLIPTIDRYPYLRTVLAQLREQTVPPDEVIIVDQTPRGDRDLGIAGEYSDLPLQVVYLDEPGQCSSRNEGIRRSKGEFILFLDDDDEIPTDLVERHLGAIRQSGADASCGVADEAGAGELPPDFRFRRASDVFPTNNTLLRKVVLQRSGLFDLAYDRGQRADGDLGMRLYLAGCEAILEPHISVFHHRAPKGGLRTHKMRVVTFASSRSRLTHRSLPSVFDFYLTRRYFSKRQQHEAKWLSIVGTFSIRGSHYRRLFKAGTACFMLPNSLWLVWARDRLAQKMMVERAYPRIPFLVAKALDFGKTDR